MDTNTASAPATNFPLTYQAIRARSRQLFGLLDDEAYYSQPIDLRHPIVFYDGHLPAFSFNTLVKRALARPSIDGRLESLFARGIDPDAPRDHGLSWPDRATVRAFVQEADRQVLDALATADLDRRGHPLLDRAEAAYAILEHEAMHQETLLYMWHRLPLDRKRRPAGYTPRAGTEASPQQEWIEIPEGRATLGVDRDEIPFGWDNEFPRLTAQVARFWIERHNVTNGAFLEFVEAGGYRDERWWSPEDWAWLQQSATTHPLFWESHVDAAAMRPDNDPLSGQSAGRPAVPGARANAGSQPRARRDEPGRARDWFWRGMFDLIPLPASWPVYVSHAEASAYARWRGAGLATEAEFQRAAYGSPHGERLHPWGSDAPSPRRGVFDFQSWDPEPAGTHPTGASAWGVEDLVGNGWEWTSTPFAPFPGFRAMASYPEYSVDFFDGEHMVMKGASPVTGRELLRPTFRNWFRRHYPYVYASFRCVKSTK